MQVRRWLPDQPTSIGRHDWPDEGGEGTHLRLRAGSIVVLDRQAWRVLEITGYPGDHWPEAYEKAWRDHVELWWHANELRRANNQAVKPAPERAEFYKRPVVLVLRNDNLPRSAPKHWCAPASQDWQVLPEHYAVCRACGELPPCHHGEYPREEGPRRPEQSGGIPFLVPKGCCMGCAEQIKPRMRTVRFPGPNLWYPDLGEDTAVFHARSSCEDQVECYRAQWQQEYEPPAVRPGTSAFPGFDHFVLPRARQSPPQPPQGPQAQPQAPQPPQSVQAAQVVHAAQAVHAAQSPQPVQAHVPHAHVPHAQAPQPQAPLPASHALLLSTAPRAGEEAHAALTAGTTGSGTFSPSFEGYRPDPEPYSDPYPALDAYSAPDPYPTPDPYPVSDPYPTPDPYPVSDSYPAPAADPGPAGHAVRAAEELSRTLTDRPAFHNAEQAARVIEELTAAVRNIALCLNNPPARNHS
ncbi:MULTISPECIES: hypothetical protein [unclassified Streptomyces]|uniref:hypothetical protein n=1 Tax=unclassified Streptomyces TaxID=2593676 RepID=UPI0006AF096C|nr:MULTISPECIES: hypothetical protein [unclassified Streptomyces]KOX38595.1 hypothetical protein ADL06_00915 [Streptomyces sp. NRRL F-6491]KOX52582.1 hypothetical protein ADL08_00255 [Streptomyces sp. NRRL F-6492]